MPSRHRLPFPGCCKLIAMNNRANAKSCTGELPPARTDADVIAPYLEDTSGFVGRAEALFTPESEAEVAAILREAQRTETPVTVSGAGTGLTGGRVALGGWVLS